MIRRLAATLAALPFLACASGPGVEDGPAPEGLAYLLPEPPSATYAFADTTRFTIQAGPMGEMRVAAAQSGLVDLTFEADDEDQGLRVVARFPRYSGQFENPQQGSVSATEADIGGPFTIELEPSGRVAVVDTPILSQKVLDITSPDGLIRPLFARLPAAPAGPGATWVDTVETRDEGLSTMAISFAVIRSTLIGDTVVDGRVLRLIVLEGQTQVEVSGESGGVQIQQRLSGPTTGLVLWDPERHLLVRREEEGTLSGTLELPGLGVSGLPVSAETRSVVSMESQPGG